MMYHRKKKELHRQTFLCFTQARDVDAAELLKSEGLLDATEGYRYKLTLAGLRVRNTQDGTYHSAPAVLDPVLS